MPNYTKKIVFITCMLLAITAYPQSDDDALEDEYGNDYNKVGRVTMFYEESNVVSSEDDPGTGTEDGGSVEDPPAPIDDYLLVLAFGGIVLAGYRFSKKL